MDKKDKVLSKDPKIKVSYSKLNNRVMRKTKDNNKGKVHPNKKNWSPLRKALNELDPNFDDYIRMATKPPTLKIKDLKAQLKKEQERRKKQK